MRYQGKISPPDYLQGAGAIIKKCKAEISPKRTAELTHGMHEIEFVLPKSRKKERVILKMD